MSEKKRTSVAWRLAAVIYLVVTIILLVSYGTSMITLDVAFGGFFALFLWNRRNHS